MKQDLNAQLIRANRVTFDMGTVCTHAEPLLAEHTIPVTRAIKASYQACAHKGAYSMLYHYIVGRNANAFYECTKWRHK